MNTTIAVPESVWKGMKNLATDRRSTSQAVWTQAAREFLAREAEA